MLARMEQQGEERSEAMFRVFIAGPYRAPTAWQRECNIHKAKALALKAWKAGFSVFCPHSNTAQFDDECPDQVWLDGIVEWLKVSEAVLVMEGYEQSPGSVNELVIAMRMKIPVFDSVEGLMEWRDKARENKPVSAQPIWEGDAVELDAAGRVQRIPRPGEQLVTLRGKELTVTLSKSILGSFESIRIVDDATGVEEVVFIVKPGVEEPPCRWCEHWLPAPDGRPPDPKPLRCCQNPGGIDVTFMCFEPRED